MLRTFRGFLFLALHVGLLLGLTGCPNPVAGTTGSLHIAVGDGVSRTLLPTVSMVPASYQIDGSGPGGAVFGTTVTGSSSTTVDDLAFGDWTVTVTASNADGTAIGTGTGTATVHTNRTTDLGITVLPFDGFGALSLTLAWPAADIEVAQVESTLLPSSGAARTLNFAVDGAAGTGSFSAGDIATGYHTLSLKLLDNGALTMGAVEVVRIVEGQATSGSLTFTNVNMPGGTLAINITPEMNDALTVSILGATATKPADRTMSLSAGISETGVNATFVWYLNGDPVAMGGSFAFDSSWAQGYYRIDVTAFSADGKRAGSATTDVQVVAAGITPPSGSGIYPLSGFYPQAFDVSDDGSLIAVGMANGEILAVLFDGDGTVRKPLFQVGSYDTSVYELWFGLDVAKARVTGQSAITWNFGTYGWDAEHVPHHDWQNWVAFLDRDGNPIGAPHLLDPGAQTGVNRNAKVRMSDDGVSAFIYEAQFQNADRLIIYGPDGTSRAAISIGSGVIMTGAMGNAVGMNRTTADIIVAGENRPHFYYQRFRSDGTPIDTQMVQVPQIVMSSSAPWSIYFAVEYNRSGTAALFANVDYPSSNQYQLAFFNPDTSFAALTPPASRDDTEVLVTASDDFIAPINGLSLYSQAGQLLSNVQGSGQRIDRWNNLYHYNGSEFRRIPYPF